MTRIVAGVRKGHNLQVPAHGTRPTSEMAREAMFSHLESRGVVQDAKVLDIFAGSGALGLEALSRGADTVLFVDSSPSAVRSITNNVVSLGCQQACKIVRGDVQKTLSRMKNGSIFDLVFIDPPYDLDNEVISQVLNKLSVFLTPNSTVVLETRKKNPVPELPEILHFYAQKNYGDTLVTYLETLAGSS